jgi:hypothetical protein
MVNFFPQYFIDLGISQNFKQASIALLFGLAWMSLPLSLALEISQLAIELILDLLQLSQEELLLPLLSLSVLLALASHE